MAEPLAYNPYAFTVHDNPYDTYRWLRDEAPAYWNSDLRFWALSRFEDVQDAFRDYETYSSAGGVALEGRRPIDRSSPRFQEIIEMDPPEHTALRMLVSRAFTDRGLVREDGSMEIPKEAADAILEVLAYFTEDLDRRRAGEVPGGGLVSDLLGSEVDGREGRVALEEIHRRMGDYTVDHDNKIRFHSGNVSGWRSLPISFTPGPRLDSVAG